MTIRRTVYGAVDQTALLLGAPVSPDFLKASALNTTFGIEPDAVPNAGEERRMRSFIMGIGAHSYTTGTGGISLPTTKNHLATDAGLFLPIPQAMRRVGDDFDEALRARYCLRNITTTGGESYITYWGRKFDTTTAVISEYEQTIENGRVVSSDPFTPTEANRKPVPVDTSSQTANILSGKVMRVSAPVTLVMDASDVAEMLNAAVILYGSEDYAYVSEIGLVVSATRTVQSPNGGGSTIAFNEAISAEIFCQIPTMISMQDRRQGLELTYNVGAMEPLYVNGG